MTPIAVFEADESTHGQHVKVDHVITKEFPYFIVREEHTDMSSQLQTQCVKIPIVMKQDYGKQPSGDW